VTDSETGYIFFGTDTSPGKIIIVDGDAGELTKVDTIELRRGEDRLKASSIDTSNHKAFFFTYTAPINGVEIDTVNLTISDRVRFRRGEDYAISATMDSVNGRTYVGTQSPLGVNNDYIVILDNSKPGGTGRPGLPLCNGEGP